MPIWAVDVTENNISSLRREALTGKEFLLADAKDKADKPVSLIATDLIDELCDESKLFTYEWTDIPANDQEMYTLWNNETGIYGVGKNRSEAIADFIDNISEYAEVYFDDLPYYLSSLGSSRNHYWYLRRVLRCDRDRNALIKVLAVESLEK